MNPTVEVISHICTTDGKRGSEMYVETLPLSHSNIYAKIIIQLYIYGSIFNKSNIMVCHLLDVSE